MIVFAMIRLRSDHLILVHRPYISFLFLFKRWRHLVWSMQIVVPGSFWLLAFLCSILDGLGIVGCTE